MRHKLSRAIKSTRPVFHITHYYPVHAAVNLLGCVFLCTQIVYAAAEGKSDLTAAELESVRTQIRDVESNIETARNETGMLLKELQTKEIAASNVSDKLEKIEAQINDQVKRLAKLRVQKSASELSLKEERKHLAQQIRAAYKMGKNDYLKLLLNQQDPARTGRMLAYYDYYNQARTIRINKVSDSLRELAQLQQTIQSETIQLDQLRAVQLAELEEFTVYRASRKDIVARLHGYIEEQGKQLQTLQKNEQELASLVNKLREEESIVQIYEEMPAFNTLEGKLSWPVRGKIKSRFGALRKGGKLRWQGVTIAAGSGTEIRAISTGKVIFADWFRNMGLLIILDHGDGYMSLYGHNQRLLKKVGDWVQTDENIAKVGDTGGQQQSGLYLEIRQNGKPLNPGLWCKG